MKFLLYGANGHTATFAIEYAKEQGINLILAGRSEESIKPLAKENGFDYRIFDLESNDTICDNLKDIDLVLNFAGPFRFTFKKMVNACLKTKTHYLDITGEMTTIEKAYLMGDQFKKAGIIVAPATAFDTLPTDSVALKLKSLMPDANKIKLAFKMNGRGSFSSGSAITGTYRMHKGSLIRKNAKIKRVSPLYNKHDIDFGDGKLVQVGVWTWADIYSGYYSTGVPNIEFYTPLSDNQIKKALKYDSLKYRILLRLPFLRNAQIDKIKKKFRNPSYESRLKSSMNIFGEAENSSGKKITIKLKTCDSYFFSGRGPIALADYISKNEVSPGFYTAGQIAGPDFVTTIKGAGQFEILQ